MDKAYVTLNRKQNAARLLALSADLAEPNNNIFKLFVKVCAVFESESGSAPLFFCPFPVL